MKTAIEISVVDVVGSDILVSYDDGEKVCRKILEVISKTNRVLISFEGASVISPCFLNSALGYLERQFLVTMERNIVGINIHENYRGLLNNVMTTYQQYFNDPERFNKALEESENEN